MANLQKIFDLFFEYASDLEYEDWDFITDLESILLGSPIEDRNDPTFAAIYNLVMNGIARMDNLEFTGSNEIIDPIYDLLRNDKRTRLRFLYAK
jgi:hypothetical protein